MCHKRAHHGTEAFMGADRELMVDDPRLIIEEDRY
jgi:hypothetical protein